MQQVCKIFSFFGPPGSGKGTLARQCKALGLKLLSTGDLCRKHVALADEIGKMLDGYLRQGKLIPDALMGEMVQAWILQETQTDGAIILDGFPRTKTQADDFLKFLKNKLSECEFEVIVFMIPDEDIVQRLSLRLVCGNPECQEVYNTTSKRPLKSDACDKCQKSLSKRNDDSSEVILERLRLFPSYRDDLMAFYKNNGCMVKEFKVANLSVDQVFENFKEFLD